MIIIVCRINIIENVSISFHWETTLCHAVANFLFFYRYQIRSSLIYYPVKKKKPNTGVRCFWTSVKRDLFYCGKEANNLGINSIGQFDSGSDAAN